ncbi:MAG: pyridine nucleotide transhydrogenase [Candidatus Levybacteria bacterium]|nr:pyridine nucleotide transhydrogenase [Candidatus Levybacteria bacterium]
MLSALIGYSGFIGGNLIQQTKFDDLYNSKNIKDIGGKNYDLVVSAATASLKWQANLEPKKDWEKIEKFIDCLKHIKTKLFILISTVDVYPNPYNVDEDTLINPAKLTQGYGRNRYNLEKFIAKTFPNAIIIRLPQTFGEGLKKNAVFDLIYNNRWDLIHKENKFQWYNLENIWKDIQLAIKNSLKLVHLAVEPLSVKEVAKYTLDLDFTNVTKNPPVNYNMLTKYGYLYGSKTKYLYDKEVTLSELKEFIKSKIK